MPEPGLFDAPLPVAEVPSPEFFPANWNYRLVTMPRRAGVDAEAGAAQLLRSGSEPDPDVAIAAAVRHWCGEDLGQLELCLASARELAEDGQPVLRIADLQLPDPALYADPDCPLVSVTEHTRLLWNPATRHLPGGETAAGWAPYGQTVVRWLDRDPSQPLAHPMNMAGLGAARTREAAIEQACADLIAQDAVMLWWRYGTEQPLAARKLASDLLAGWQDSRLELRLRVTPSPTGLETVIATVLDSELNIATLSAATGSQAISGATAQALWQHALAHDLQSVSGGLHQLRLPGILPHRPDRSYLAESGPGQRRAIDPFAAVQIGLDPAVRSALDRRTAPYLPRQPHREHQPDSEGAIGGLQSLLRAGYEVWVVELTTPDVAVAGWHCFRVIVPGLARIPVPAFPLDPNGATAAAAAKLGWAAQALESLPYPGW